jgi:hypothetical protein
VNEREDLKAEMTRKGELYRQELREKDSALQRLATSNEGRRECQGIHKKMTLAAVHMGTNGEIRT